MNKLWKGIVIMIACAAMVISSSSPVFAQDPPESYTIDGKVYIITASTDGESVTIVNVKSVDGTSTVVLDRNTNVIRITEVNAAGSLVINETITMVDAAAELPKTDAIANSSTLVASGSETMWKHFYSVTKMGSPAYYNWVVCKSTLTGTCKTRKETSGNTADLTGFKDDINSAAKNEVIARAMVGAGVLTAIAGAIAALSTVSLSIIIGLLIAFGAGVGAAAYIYSAWVDVKDANYHYGRV